MRKLAALLTLAALSASLSTPAAASSPGVDRRDYAAAIELARSYVQEAENGRPDAAAEALAALNSVGADRDLPEVKRDLQENPPDLTDADHRLAAASGALSRPGEIADAGHAHQQIQSILADGRYDYLRKSPPNPIVNAIDSFLSWLLGVLSHQNAGVPSLPAIPTWVWLTLLIAILAAALGFGLYQARGLRPRRRGRTAHAAPAAKSEAARHAEDRFTTADRLAAAGDHTAALRALMAGVATEISGRVYWEQSSLTVRELFRDTGRIDQLRPLLLAFEGTVYGGRDVEAEQYAECLRLAAPFRPKQDRDQEAA